MTPAQVKQLETELAVVVKEAVGPGASKVLADAWRAEHAKVLASGRARKGVPPDFLVAVDSQRGKPVEQAQALIVSLYDYRREAALFALDALARNSPRQSGQYVQGHTIFVNRAATGKTCPPLREGDDIYIANTVPYARRIEIGRTKAGRSFVAQVPPRVYERTVKEIRARYGSVVKLAFGYVDLPGAWTIKGGLSPSYQTGGSRRTSNQFAAKGSLKSRKRNQRVGEPIRYPAIFIRDLD